MVQTRIDTPEDIARCMKIKWDLGLAGGLVIGNPFPPKNAMDESLIEGAITEAFKEATEKEKRRKRGDSIFAGANQSAYSWRKPEE
ncbi:MAG: hypothetical protein Ct9H300mP21_06890 [Pseudomonadota bacterium]|nr:MAG: hypothetical protein Ct9H300mP21_06890 [Pseudomonadota bacterium]